MKFEYEKNGFAIYKKSFAIIRKESDLSGFSNLEEKILVRMIHASGNVKLSKEVFFSKDMAVIAEKAIKDGANILCDTNMVKYGITLSRLPANNKVICLINEEKTKKVSEEIKNTRSAAGVQLWKPYLKNSIVAIGNAPTALFHLLNLLQFEKYPKPAAIIGFPVGFVGAKESKEALLKSKITPFCTIYGRLGGSAMTSAVVNALANRKE